MLIKVDYVGLRLTKAYDLEQFAKDANEHIIDENTGQILGYRLEPFQWKSKIINSYTKVIMFYKGGEDYAIKLQKEHNLPITRIDIALDFECANNMLQSGLYKKYVASIKDHFEREGWRVPLQYYDNTGKGENGDFGFNCWARGGIKQLRVYMKKGEVEPKSRKYTTLPRVRVEWQLRGDLAKAAYDAFSPSYPDCRTELIGIFKGLCDKWLGGDIFNLGEGEAIALVMPTKETTEDGLRKWLFDTVVRSIVRLQLESGEDIMSQLQGYVDKMMLDHVTQKGNIILTRQEKQLRAAEFNQNVKIAEMLERGEKAALDEAFADI